MRTGLMAMAAFLATAALASAAPKSETRRINDAARVVSEIRSAPDRGISDGIWDRARCVAVLPGVKKAAFLIGGEFGKGVMSCRTDGGWSSPVFLQLEKGSFGAQIGAESTDVVLLIMNDSGLDRLLQDKVTLGTDASLAAGPVGRTGSAATDIQLTAEILSYSRARGLFAGIDLSGGVLRPDTDATRELYGRAVTDREVLMRKAPAVVPAAARPFIAALTSGVSRAASKPRG